MGYDVFNLAEECAAVRDCVLAPLQGKQACIVLLGHASKAKQHLLVRTRRRLPFLRPAHHAHRVFHSLASRVCTGLSKASVCKSWQRLIPSTWPKACSNSMTIGVAWCACVFSLIQRSV